MKNYQITQWCANFIRQQVTEGDFCIDATMGNGNDTLLLSQLCKTTGKVLAFDIQKQALAATREKLVAEHAPQNYTLLLESHANMSKYAEADSISCIVFNFGYLPGGDHSLATRGGGTWYQEMQNPFGGMPTGSDDYCMKLCLANLACSLCCPGGGVFCC